MSLVMLATNAVLNMEKRFEEDELTDACKEFIEIYEECDKSWTEMLGYSCEFGYLDIVKHLIENGKVDIHYGEEQPICDASFFRHLPIVKYLDSQGANLFYNDCLAAQKKD
jgi:hypothetical protein